jgi:hypothetical protein
MPNFDDLSTLWQAGASIGLLSLAVGSIRLLYLVVLRGREVGDTAAANAIETRASAATAAVEFYRVAAADAERRAELAEARAESYLAQLLDKNGKKPHGPLPPPPPEG